MWSPGQTEHGVEPASNELSRLQEVSNRWKATSAGMLIVHCTSASPSMSIVAALSAAISWCVTCGADQQAEPSPSGISYKRAKPFSFSPATPTVSDDLHVLLAADRSKHRNPPLGALLFSCCRRGEGFFGEPHHDSRVVQERIGPIPVAGFSKRGRSARRRKNFLHGLYGKRRPSQAG